MNIEDPASYVALARCGTRTVKVVPSSGLECTWRVLVSRARALQQDGAPGMGELHLLYHLPCQFVQVHGLGVERDAASHAGLGEVQQVPHHAGHPLGAA